MKIFSTLDDVKTEGISVDSISDAPSLQTTKRGRPWKGKNPPSAMVQCVPVSTLPPHTMELPDDDPNITSECIGNLFYFRVMNIVSFHSADRMTNLFGGWSRIKNENTLRYQYKNLFLNQQQFHKLCQSCLPTPCIIAAEEEHYDILNSENSLVQFVLLHSTPSMNHYMVSQRRQVLALVNIVKYGSMTGGMLHLIEYLIDHGISTMYEERIEDKGLGGSKYVPHHVIDLIDYPAVQQRVEHLRKKSKKMKILMEIMDLFLQRKDDYESTRVSANKVEGEN